MRLPPLGGHKDCRGCLCEFGSNLIPRSLVGHSFVSTHTLMLIFRKCVLKVTNHSDDVTTGDGFEDLFEDEECDVVEGGRSLAGGRVGT